MLNHVLDSRKEESHQEKWDGNLSLLRSMLIYHLESIEKLLLSTCSGHVHFKNHIEIAHSLSEHFLDVSAFE